MAGSGRRITIQFLGEDKSVGKTANQVEGRMSRMGGKLAKVGKIGALGFAAVGAGAIIMGKQVISSASSAQQSLGGTQAVFGKFADAVIKRSNEAATAFGLSANEYRENANIIGSLLKNQGVSQDKLGKSTDKMIKLGSDLAATYGGTTKDAVEALSSAYKGEFDPLEQFGISLKQSAINTEAMRVAGVKTTAMFNKLTPAQQAAAKGTATQNLLMKQAAPAQGQFAKQTNTLAEQQQILGARFENLKATLGQKLLPIATKVVTWISDLIGKFQSGEGAGGKFKEIFAKIGNVIRPIGEWIGNDLVPFIKDLGHRFNEAMGGTAGFKKSMSDLKPAITVVKEVLRILWEGLKIAIKVILPMVVQHFKLLTQSLGIAGKTVIWLWNNAFQPTLKFILRGLGWVIDKIADMLGALGKVPGFGWAKDAADKLHLAAKQAGALADGIKKIPKDTTVNIQVKTKYTDNKGIGSAGQANFPRKRAAGGPVRAGEPYVVGERRPEVFVPSQNGRIAPRVPTGGGGVTINFNGLVTDPKAAAREVRRILLDLQRTTGPLGLA